MADECVRRRDFFEEISKIIDTKSLGLSDLSSELSGNAVLFISDDINVEPDELESAHQ